MEFGKRVKEMNDNIKSQYKDMISNKDLKYIFDKIYDIELNTDDIILIVLKYFIINNNINISEKNFSDLIMADIKKLGKYYKLKLDDDNKKNLKIGLTKFLDEKNNFMAKNNGQIKLNISRAKQYINSFKNDNNNESNEESEEKIDNNNNNNNINNLKSSVFRLSFSNQSFRGANIINDNKIQEKLVNNLDFENKIPRKEYINQKRCRGKGTNNSADKKDVKAKKDIENYKNDIYSKGTKIINNKNYYVIKSSSNILLIFYNYLYKTI